MSQNCPTLPAILLVEPDDVARPILTENLRNWGYEVIVSLDEADALQRTRAGRQTFDLLLLNQVGQSIEWLIDMGRKIRQQTERSHSIPIVLLVEEYGVELEGQTVQVGEQEYITYLEDGQQLKNLLYQLCPVQGD